MITQDDIDAVRVQISRISDLNTVVVDRTGNSVATRTDPAVEQAAYALSRLLDLIENLSHQLETQCQTDTCPRSSSPPSST